MDLRVHPERGDKYDIHKWKKFRVWVIKNMIELFLFYLYSSHYTTNTPGSF